MADQALSPLAILRKSGKLSAVNVLGYGLAMVAGLVTARALGPENVGILALVGVWLFYLRLVQPGLLSVAQREIPHQVGLGKPEDARRIQNIAVTGELVFSLLPFGVLVAAGFFSQSSLIRIGLWISAVGLLVATVQAAWVSLLYAHQRFDLVVRVTLVLSVVSPVGILLTVSWLGIYSPLLMPIVAGVAALVMISRWREAAVYQPAWNWKTGFGMAKTGLSLTVLTIVLSAYVMSDRPAILAAGLSLTMVGYYVFASNFVRSAAQLFWDFTSVLQPILWHELGRRGSVAALSREIVRLWVPYTMAGCLAATLGQAVFGALVAWVAPNFARSVPVFEILVFLLVFQNATQLPNLLLHSKVLNRQNLSLLIWTGGLALNLAVLYAMARAGCSLSAIAAASMGVDAGIAILVYAAVHRWLFRSWRAALTLYGWLVGLSVIGVGLYGVFQYGAFAYTVAGPVWIPLALRTATALLVWGAVALVVFRWLRSASTERQAAASPALSPVSVEELHLVGTDGVNV